MAFLQEEEEKEHSIEHVYFIITRRQYVTCYSRCLQCGNKITHLFTNFEYIFKILQFHFCSVLDSRQTLTFDLPKFKAKGL